MIERSGMSLRLGPTEVGATEFDFENRAFAPPYKFEKKMRCQPLRKFEFVPMKMKRLIPEFISMIFLQIGPNLDLSDRGRVPSITNNTRETSEVSMYARIIMITMMI